MDGKGVARAGNGSRAEVRAERKDGFSPEKRQLFLDHLAGCSTVRRAAAAAGVAVTTFYNHRRRDPAFAQACAEALEVGYEALEAMLLERAARGGRPAPGAVREDGPGPESMDIPLAQFLMGVRARAMGRRTGDVGHKPQRASEKELTEAILAKLALFDARERKKKSGKKAKEAGK